MGIAETIVVQAVHELALFAAVGIAIGGVDDLIVDLIWFARSMWRRMFVYSRHARADATALKPDPSARIAVFVPAWREAPVIGAMLATARTRWGDQGYRIYVGGYRNDPETLAAIPEAPTIRVVVNPRSGPTTKGDNLNAMWRAMLADEAAEGSRFTAIALHDAEDVVHPAEIAIYRALCPRFDLVQLPVLPLIETGRGMWRRFVSAVAADEFAESHAKALVVREAIGAALPSAGVGCAFARDTLGRIAGRFGAPFDEGSVTEDYELGLRIHELGGRGAFVRLPGRAGGAAVAVRAHFPDTMAAAVRQKARWQAGIALSGWMRLGWRGGLAERWMRLRDRRTILAALVLLCAYVSGASLIALAMFGHAPAFSTGEQMLFWLCTLLMLWRLAMRGYFVARSYGVAEGIASLPRVLLGNLIAMAAARRALVAYLGLARGAPLVWDKTEHDFPRTVPAE